MITQKNRPIAFFSRKLTAAQCKYSVTEIELLAIVETLKEFKGMLWGQPVKVYTDHKNLMRDALGLTSDRVYRWRLLLEEYGPEIVYIKGKHNTVADAISRLEYEPSVNKTAESYRMTKVKRHLQTLFLKRKDPLLGPRLTITITTRSGALLLSLDKVPRLVKRVHLSRTQKQDLLSQIATLL